MGVVERESALEKNLVQDVVRCATFADVIYVELKLLDQVPADPCGASACQGVKFDSAKLKDSEAPVRRAVSRAAGFSRHRLELVQSPASRSW